MSASIFLVTSLDKHKCLVNLVLIDCSVSMGTSSSAEKERPPTRAGGRDECFDLRYFGPGRWKINDRVTSDRPASGSVRLVNKWMIASCSSGERLSRSPRTAARTLSCDAKSFVAIQV